MSTHDKLSSAIDSFGAPENTIAAVASPRAAGAIGVIRLSGPESVSISAKIFTPAAKNADFPPNPRTMTLGFISDPKDGRRVDQATIVFYPAPNSYTGEDVIEIFCHGGLLVTREILDLLSAAGASPAQPGEFTCRAFLNGKLDLAQAESVLCVVNARNRNYLDAAVRQLDGSLSSPVKSLRRKLIDLLANIEVAIEFSDDHSSQFSREDMQAIILGAIDGLNNIINSADSVRLSNDSLKVAIIGKPNVGKSSLMNRLLGKDRVIVSDIPGTTRDLVGDYIAIGGFDFLLMDTAGITVSENTIEAEGVRRTHTFLKSADIVLALFDGSCSWSSDDDSVLEAIETASSFCLPIVTKYDLQRCLDISLLSARFASSQPTFVSSLTGEGLKSLYDRLNEFADSRSRFSPDSIILNLRHRSLLDAALSSLSHCIKNVFSVPDDILAIDIKEAADSLGKITGETTSEDVISSIFENFCVGK